MINSKKNLTRSSFHRDFNDQAGQTMMIATLLFVALSVTIMFGLVGPVIRQQVIVRDLSTSRQT